MAALYLHRSGELCERPAHYLLYVEEREEKRSADDNIVIGSVSSTKKKEKELLAIHKGRPSPLHWEKKKKKEGRKTAGDFFGQTEGIPSSSYINSDNQ